MKVESVAERTSGAPSPADYAALERVRRRWESDPYVRLLGIEIVECRGSRALARMPLAESIRNAASGPPHGGSLCSLMDIAIGVAVNAANAIAGEGQIGQTTTDLNISFLEGARSGPITCEAGLVRRGRSLVVGEATVTDGDGRTIAVGRATFMLFRPEARR